jgi:hypothetical protein
MIAVRNLAREDPFPVKQPDLKELCQNRLSEKRAGRCWMSLLIAVFPFLSELFVDP